MRVKDKIRLYVSNIVSFANSKTRNTLRDRSVEFYSNIVTPELCELMRSVWQPIVGSDHDIYVLHVHKSRQTKNLGISLQGTTRYATVQLTNAEQLNKAPERDHCIHSTNNEALNQNKTNGSVDGNLIHAMGSNAGNTTTTTNKSNHYGQYEDSAQLRHFIECITPNGLIGGLGVAKPGDELLQVNGRRLRGCSHSNVIRYLRHLPSHIQLVLARVHNPIDKSNENGDGSCCLSNSVTEFTKLKESILQGTDDPIPLDVQASDVGSVDTTLSDAPYSPITQSSRCAQDQYHPPISYSPTSGQKRASEWVRNSFYNNEAQLHYDPNPTMGLLHRQASPTTGSVHNELTSDTDNRTIMRKYSLHTPKTSRASHITAGMSKLRRAQTLPRQFSHSPVNRIDPRYGTKRPTWSTVPLVIELYKSGQGFGFSIADYEELAVVDLADKSTVHRSRTIGRRCSIRSKHSSNSGILKQNTISGYDSKNQSKRRRSNMLLIDSLIPGGLAQMDGRISVGDRLLFVNDRNLMNSDVKSAARALQSIPQGPCLIGIAKIQLESNVYNTGGESDQLASITTYAQSLPRNYTTGMTSDALWDNFNVTSTNDMAVDFDFIPVLCLNPELHRPNLDHIPPLDWDLERTIEIDVGAQLSIGLKLDALPCQGQDGCRVLQIQCGSAVARDKRLHSNDYITTLNGITMRHLDNLQAFQVLHSLSKDNDCRILEVKYFPASLIETHRFAYLSDPGTHIRNVPKSITTYPLVHMANWSPPVEIILHRSSVKEDWGIILTGPQYDSHMPYVSKLSLVNPSLVNQIQPGSVAAVCHLVQPGLLVLQIQGVDVTDCGPVQANERLVELSASDTLTLQLVVSNFDADNLDATVVPAAVTTTTTPTVNAQIDLNYNELPPPLPSNGQCHELNDKDFYPIVNGFSHSSSDMENPDSLTDKEPVSRGQLMNFNTTVQVVNINNHSSNCETNLASLPCPTLCEDDQLKSGDENLSSDTCTQCLDPPPIAPKPVTKSVLNNCLRRSTPDSIEQYIRPDQPDDEIIEVNVGPSPQALFESKYHKFSLGIRLVGSRQPNMGGAFILNFSSDVNTYANLRVGDEIVQVESTNVAGLSHLLVQQSINKILNQKLANYQQSITESHATDADATGLLIRLVIRRNPINRCLMASPVVQKSISDIHTEHQLSVNKDLSATTVEDGGLVALPSGGAPIANSFLQQIMLTLDGDVGKFQLFDVTLKRGASGFGIFLVNLGPNGEQGVFVSSIKENSPAAMQGVLQEYDRILAINCKLQSDYEESLRLLLVSESVSLTIGRTINQRTSSPTVETDVNCIEDGIEKCTVQEKRGSDTLISGIPAIVTLFRESVGLGFSIVGGSNTILNNILIHEVHKGGPADRDGRLKSGDRLLAVNGIDLRNASQEQATKIISSANDCVQLLVCRSPHPQHLVQSMIEYQNVILTRTSSNQNLGLLLGRRPNYSTGSIILQIFPNTPAAMCKSLRIGDILLEVNGVDVRLATSHEVLELLKVDFREVNLLVGRYRNTQDYQIYHTNSLIVNTVVLVQDSVKQLANENLLTNQKSTPRLANKMNYDNCDVNIDNASFSCAFGFGIRIAHKLELYDTVSYFIVDSIHPTGVADRSHMMLPGDRVLTLDREPIDWLTPSEFVCLLSTLTDCALELGRAQYTCEQIGLLPICAADEAKNTSTPDCASDAVENRDHIYTQCFQTPDTLPAFFEASMPDIESPQCMHVMGALTELEESEHGHLCDYDDMNREPLPVTSLAKNLTTPPDLLSINAHNQAIVDCELSVKPLTQSEIQLAEDVAERLSGSGYQMRQLSLPLPQATGQQQLGLYLIKGSGVSGPIVARIEIGSPASQTDLSIGDRIIGLDDRLFLINVNDHTLDDISISRRIEQIWLTSEKPCCLTIVTNRNSTPAKPIGQSTIVQHLPTTQNGVSISNGVGDRHDDGNRMITAYSNYTDTDPRSTNSATDRSNNHSLTNDPPI